MIGWLGRNAHEFAPVIRPDVARPDMPVFDFSADSPDAAEIADLEGPSVDGLMHAQNRGPGGGRFRYRPQRQIWGEIAPDPSVVLGFPVKASVLVARSADWLVGQRQRRIGRTLSIASMPRHR